jgi:hypothetical protein
MTIQQTIDIPASRRVYFEFLAPQGIPLGVAEVAITFNGTAKPKAAVNGESWRSLRGLFKDTGDTLDAYLERHRAENELEQESAAKIAKRVAEGRRPFEGLRGALQNSGVFSGDPVEIIRKMRDEW